MWYPCSAQGPLWTRVIWLIRVFSAPLTNRWSSGLRHLRFRRSSRLRCFRRSPKNRHSPTSSGIRTLEPQVENLVCLIDYLKSITLGQKFPIWILGTSATFRLHLLIIQLTSVVQIYKLFQSKTILRFLYEQIFHEKNILPAQGFEP